MTEDYFRVGVIANTHGVRGEAKVFPTTEDPQRFRGMKEIILDTGKEKRILQISSVRFFKNLVIIKFKDIDTLNEIEKYKGMDLLVSRENAIPLQEGEYYIADILGAKVVTEDDSEFGIIKDVLITGANDVYVVEHDGNEVLIPVIADCIIKRDMEKKIVVVRLLKGLLD